MKYYITISTDISSYGVGMTKHQMQRINENLSRAARQCGIEVVENDNNHAVRAELERAGATEFDWFARWCRHGMRGMADAMMKLGRQ